MAADYGLITLTDPSSPISESYRTLRMNLQFASLDTQLQTLLVTSCNQGEGKSTTLANLAVTMAQIDQRIIIVDADLRRPYLHTLFGVSNDVGLTTMMLDDAALAEPPLHDLSVPGLSFLATGTLPPRPSDLLGSKRMGSVIDALKERADIILCDAPPILAATDAVVLATKVDGVLLVVSAGETKRDNLRNGVATLQKVNAPIVGAVLNKVPMGSGMQSYYG